MIREMLLFVWNSEAAASHRFRKVGWLHRGVKLRETASFEFKERKKHAPRLM
jgi:hypothetical protein